MRFPLDESADARLAAHLVREGHDVTVIARDYPNALDDEVVLAIAYDEGRILITNDRDFGDLVFRQQRPHAGVILFRLTTTDLPSKIARLAEVLADYRDRLDHFLVVTDQRIRVRQRQEAPEEG
jgi:predicted nuclease of predicted toxin-antitoxin system